MTRLFQRGGSPPFPTNGVHERLIVAGTVGTLREPLPARAIRDLTSALVKMNSYSTAQRAHATRARQKKPLSPAQCGTAAWTFLRTYVLRAGFLDGREGFMLAFPNAGRRVYRYLKLMLLAEKSGGKSVITDENE